MEFYSTDERAVNHLPHVSNAFWYDVAAIHGLASMLVDRSRIYSPEFDLQNPDLPPDLMDPEGPPLDNAPRFAPTEFPPPLVEDNDDDVPLRGETPAETELDEPDLGDSSDEELDDHYTPTSPAEPDTELGTAVRHNEIPAPSEPQPLPALTDDEPKWYWVTLRTHKDGHDWRYNRVSRAANWICRHSG